MPKLTTKKEASRIAGVAPTSITYQTSENRALHCCVVDNRIDVEHPVFLAYVKKMQARPPGSVNKVSKESVKLQQRNELLQKLAMESTLENEDIDGPKNTDSTTAEQQPVDVDTSVNFLVDQPGGVDKLLGRTLSDILSEYGTETAFLDWLRACKSIEDINEKRTKNAVAAGSLISRELVKLSVIDPIDQALTQLLTDVVKTSITRLDSMQRNDETIADREEYLREQMASVIRPLKSKLVRTMRDA